MFEKILKNLGFDAKDIAEIKKAEEADSKDFDIEPILSKFKESQRKLYENDADLVADLETKAKGKILDIVTRKLKQSFSLSSEQVKDKKIEEVIDIAKSESVKGLSKDLQALQEENTQLTAEVKKLKDEEIPKIRTEVDNEKKIFKIKNSIQKYLPKADDRRVPMETIELVLDNQLHSGYDLDLDDNGEIIIYQKGKKLQVKSSDGTKLLTAQDVVNDILKKNKFIKESNADDIKTTPGNGDPNKKNFQPAGEEKPKNLTTAQKKAIEHAQAMQKEREEKAKGT